ncbi:lysosomal acid glucosylceramidase isoform X1 [Bombus terrestris]|uniref:Glucosylceramidase n=2 Tax=Bombus terrestris TaxID=30195 RepID=A0A9B0BNI7_BOMTE|nr:lysosomal acid glucosylceramidase isoform X1 [Bombus terrestris]
MCIKCGDSLRDTVDVSHDSNRTKSLRRTSSIIMWDKCKASLLLVILVIVAGDANDCVPRDFGQGNIVCVCNATYCDELPDSNPKVPENGTFYWYVSSKEGLRLNMIQARMGSCQNSSTDTVLNIDTSKKYQSILGFGGAFTDSAGINIKNLSEAAQDQLMRTYYGSTGSRYSLGRIPIAGTDFSTRPYTYDDVPNDLSLQNFSLAQEDYDYKIPYLRKAIELNPDVKFFSAAWSAPPWMKTNDRINGFGFLRKDRYQVYANYIVKFLDAYKSNGIDVWAVSTGNEPLNAYVPFDRLNTMGWTPDTLADWVANYAGPTLAASTHNGTKILVLDDQRIELPWFVNKVFKDKTAKKYIVGTAVHWYTDSFAPPILLDLTHYGYPDKFILMTEACTGAGTDYPKVALGSWSRGQEYILSIIQYMNHWAVGWVDWNIALDATGGPNWIQNYVDSPIIVNADADEFYKQPMYYALKHFSRFVDRGSIRISITDTDDVKATAFLTPSDQVVVVLYNNNTQKKNIVLNDPKKNPICLELPAYSMNTVIYAQ